MPYTRQQITGGPSFSSTTRVGNWNEDLEVHQERQNKLLEMEANGELLTQKMDRKFQNHCSKVELAQQRESDFVQFGEPVLLFNEDTKAFVSVDLDAKLHHIKERFAVTSAPADGAIRRNAFALERYVPKTKQPEFYDYDTAPTTLHYGQTFRIRIYDPDFHNGNELFLRSQRQSPSVCAPVTRNAQEVSVDSHQDFAAVWKVVYRDPKLRLDFEGTPVRGNYPLCIVHAQSGEMLSSSTGAVMRNDFGKEYEVCAKANRNIHKVEEECNVFYFVVGGMKREQNHEE